MSAFLGPIHLKMYDRILYQDTMSQAILDLVARNKWTCGLEEHVNKEAPPASRKPLAELIDQDNIHGWLNEAVGRSEGRYAHIVCETLAGHPERIEELQETMAGLGREYDVAAGGDVEQAYQLLHDILLDGMPCDFPFTVTESGPEEVSWQVVNCPHMPYWKEAGCDVENYYILRDAWITGALESAGISHTRTAPFNHVMKREG